MKKEYDIVKEIDKLKTSEKIELFKSLKVAVEYKEAIDDRLEKIRDLMPCFKFGERFKRVITSGESSEIHIYQDNKIKIVYLHYVGSFRNPPSTIINLNNVNECYNNENTLHYLDTILTAIKSKKIT